jgi:hypothetical protein
MEQTTMNLRPDYSRIAAELNSAALNKKLEEMTQRVPTRKRPRLAEVLGPYTEKLLKLHGLGWTYRQLAEELRANGLPVSIGSLREHLSTRARERKPNGHSAGRKQIRVPCRPALGPGSERS